MHLKVQLTCMGTFKHHHSCAPLPLATVYDLGNTPPHRGVSQADMHLVLSPTIVHSMGIHTLAGWLETVAGAAR